MRFLVFVFTVGIATTLLDATTEPRRSLTTRRRLQLKLGLTADGDTGCHSFASDSRFGHQRKCIALSVVKERHPHLAIGQPRN